MALTACSAPERLTAVPAADQTRAEAIGIPGVRYSSPEHMKRLEQDALESVQRDLAHRKAMGQTGPLPAAEFLAISGGGEDGAFGAGLLLGWTAHGSRPTFKLVTGVSTGALSAPFAFLGPKYDPQLREVYTRITAKDILEPRGMLRAIFSDAMSDTTPLQRLVQRLMNADMMKDIAAEHAKGRILLIGSTNLDGRHGVIWNVTKIAASGHPGALDLIHRILVASAAVPGAFPPVMIDVEVDGRRYQEMHVDGGATAQVFVYPPSLHVGELSRQHQITRQRRMYVIRNARLDADWAQVDRRLMSIAGRSISSLIQTQGVGDLYKISAEAKRDGIDFNLAFIPSTFKVELKEPFDTVYMNALFEVGYDLGKRGYVWNKAPPGMAGSAPPATR
ncbi:MAG: patatin-like phospholipase family protein [Rhodospirillales bacterium]|nr:patatin-like phospholipase family protein [Rhodospirillales bacterium]